MSQCAKPLLTTKQLHEASGLRRLHGSRKVVVCSCLCQVFTHVPRERTLIKKEVPCFATSSDWASFTTALARANPNQRYPTTHSGKMSCRREHDLRVQVFASTSIKQCAETLATASSRSTYSPCTRTFLKQHSHHGAGSAHRYVGS